jgi:predicted ATPase/serine phosphatase RsbU (regulator of sigma subunit)
MADQNLRFLLTIGSYRKEEVPALHPLQIMLNGINARGKKITVVELGPLSVTETHRIITNILKSDDENALSLAAIVHEKTLGNPFFINQFMKSLYEEAIISHDIHQGWRMDLHRIRKEQVTDNVVALLSNKIQKLPKPVIDILKICACIGNRYELDTLSRVMGKALPETIALLSAAVGEGYIAIHEDMYRFQHDRIEEAVYSLIPEGEKKKRHYEIGKIILEHTSEEELPMRVMYIASHLNHGKEHLTAEERALCARLNLMAGEKSIKSNAYASGRVYLRAGADLLDESAWETDYSLAYSLHKSLMQCGYLSSHFEEAEQIFEMAVERARSVIDKVDLYILMVHLKSVRGEFEEAIRLGFKGFQIIGSLDLNEKTSLEGLIAEYEKTKNLVNALEQEGISLEEIHLFPDKEDPLILRTIKLIGYVSTPAIVINPLLAATIALKPLNFILSHRAVFVRSSYTFPAAGAIICGIFKDYDLGCRIGHVGLHFPHTVTQFFLIYSNCIVHWNAHVNETMDYLAQGYRFGMEIGQTDVAALCLASLFRLKLLLGENLDFTYQELCQYDPILDNDDNPFIVSTIQVLKSFYLGMKQATPPFFNDSHILQLRQGGKSLYYLNALLVKLVLHYLVDDDMERCHEICQEANAFSHNWLATATMPEYYLFYSLVLAAKIGDPEKDRALTDELRKNEALFKTWAGLSPVNYHHRHLLVQAELARVEKRFLDAELFYHQAITRAAAVNFLHHEALSSECAGQFYLKRGLTDIARMHLRHAYGCYNRWGADAKCRRLETLHPEMFPKELEGGFREEAGKFSEKGQAAPQLSLDIRSILKASQTISQEISLKNLFSTLIRIVMENAGAEKGVILLEENGHFLIEAMGTLKQGPLSLPESIPFEASEDLSKAIVTYVIRTREYLILDHAAVIGNFTSDPYVRKTAPKSILCLPIVHQGRLTGILYLENTLTTGAFTEERLEVLRLLSSQMAISIENAKLYQTVEKKVAERTTQLKEAMASLMIVKDELWGEMQLAKRIQRALLPKEPVIPGYDIAAHMESSLEVGGDYYDVIRQNGIHWVIIGDVSGHGVSAGLVMMMVQTALHTALSGDSTPSPSALLETVNTTLFHNMKALGEDKYMTLTLFAVHEGGEIFFAGLHQDIMIYRAEKREVETIETKGFWIGITSDIRGMMPVGRFSMDIGDTLLVFTDGLTEAVLNRDSRKSSGGSREPFGEEKLKALLQERCHGRSPTEIKEEILKALEAYDRGDDLTILLLKRISS